MELSDLLIESFGRVTGHVESILDGLTAEQLRARPAADANSIGWLLWHLTRVQDEHVAELLGSDQIWLDGDHASGFGLTPDPHDTGYGHTTDQVDAVRPTGPDAVTAYYAAVWARTEAFLATLGAAELDQIVDERWDPPVTMGVRLVSIVDDAVQHAGQAAYVKGLVVDA